MSILKKYHYWIDSAKFTAIQKFAILFMGIVSFMLLARVLGPSVFGVWGLFYTISSITETARTALIRNAFIRFMHQGQREEEPFLQGSALILSFLISIFLSVVFLFFAGPIAEALNAPGLATMLRIYPVALLLTTLTAHFEMLLNAKLDFRRICWMQCLRHATLFILIATCFFGKIHLEPVTLSFFYLASVTVGSVAGLKLTSSYLTTKYNRYRNWLPRLWRFGRFVFGNNICSLLFRSTDNFITSIMFGPAVSAFYNASLRISNLVDMPSVVFADVLFPKAAKYNISHKKSIKNIYEKTVGATLVFSIPALLVLLVVPGFILYILAGEKFVVASDILRITAFFGFTLPFLKQFGTIMDATGRPDISFKLMLFALCINVGTNLVAINFFGMIGAAIGTATTYCILFFVSQFVLYRMFGVSCLNIFRTTLSFYLEIFHTAKLTLSTIKGAGKSITRL